MAGRPNQKQRTRKDLLTAAARLVRDGRAPSLDEVAEAAMVSRATAYRYFPNIEGLLVEAVLDMVAPNADAILGPGAPTDPVARVERIDSALHEMVLANEASLRLMLAHSMNRAVRGEDAGDLPVRQNRRTPMIEAALEPLHDTMDAATFDRLTKALALIIGTEAMIVFKDVLQVGDAEARAVKRWAIRALVEAAVKG